MVAGCEVGYHFVHSEWHAVGIQNGFSMLDRTHGVSSLSRPFVLKVTSELDSCILLVNSIRPIIFNRSCRHKTLVYDLLAYIRADVNL